MWLETFGCARFQFGRRARRGGQARLRIAAAALTLLLASAAAAQSPGVASAALRSPSAAARQNAPAPTTPAQTAPAAAGQSSQAASPATHVSLDRAIELALQHNHTLLAARSTIDQSRAQEVTANLRPNPTINADAQFLPIFQPSLFSASYLDTSAQFDLGISYLIERGHKRQNRLKAAQDQTAVTTATVGDNERTLIFNVALQFIAALQAKANLELARMDLASFQNTVQISQARYNAGGISEGDLLKIRLQLLQFQQDVSAAELAQVQALASLRQALGFESVPENYDVDGQLMYRAVPGNQDDLKMLALRNRPDLRAAELGVTAAQSQYNLAKANGKRDVSVAFNYDHVAQANTASIFGSIQLPIFDRNQGEIARTGFAITQAQETETASSQGVLSDVVNAYEGLRTADRVVNLFTGGYLNDATQSRDISQYAYERGAASLLDFLDAERNFRTTQLAYNQALATHMLAVEQLRQAVGTRSLP